MLDVYYGHAILINGQMSSGWPNFAIFSLANDLGCVQLDDVKVFGYNVGSINPHDYMIKDLTLNWGNGNSA